MNTYVLIYCIIHAVVIAVTAFTFLLELGKNKYLRRIRNQQRDLKAQTKYVSRVIQSEGRMSFAWKSFMVTVGIEGLCFWLLWMAGLFK